MQTNQYIIAIEEVLRRIPELEQAVEKAQCPCQHRSLARSLKLQRKRFERMISYQDRRSLQNLCMQLGIDGKFE